MIIDRKQPLPSSLFQGARSAVSVYRVPLLGALMDRPGPGTQVIYSLTFAVR